MKNQIKIRQRSISDCGAACLASVAAYYGLQIPVGRIRQYCGTDKKGTNIDGLLEGAERIGFQAKAAKGTLESLFKIPLPAIAHIVIENGLHHFVVVYKVTKRKVTIMDPGNGTIEEYDIERFKSVWTNIIVVLLPNENFVKGNQKISKVERFWNLLRPHKYIMLQALIGALVYTILGLFSSIYVQKIVDFVLPDGNTRLLNVLSISMIAILFFQLFIGLFKSILGLQTGQQIDATLILEYYKHLLKLPLRFFDTMRVGEIVSRFNDAVKIRLFINDVALSIAVNVFIIIFSIGLMMFYYWNLAILILAIIPLYLALFWVNNKVNRKWQRTLMENSAELESQLVESLNAVGTIKRLGLEQYANDKTESRFVSLLDAIYKSTTRSLYIGTFAELVTRLFTIMLLWVGSYYVLQRELSPGELLSFHVLIGYFTGPAISLLGANKSMQDALIAADRLFEIIDLETEPNTKNKVTLTAEIVGDIEFKNVHFKYGSKVPVFDDLNFRIIKNQTTAIVGESGSGKSTILSLMQNLYPLHGGSISIGGLDLENISNSSLRQIVAAVPQQVDLFVGTIIDNIAIGDYEPDIKRVIEISKILGIDEFVEKMPATYNTYLNEQGVNLSGGQRQRIAIARALYRNPEILVLDEATSSLDTLSEQKVKRTLDKLRIDGKTIVIIAHRLETIKDADNILVLGDGGLIESGTHDVLIKKRGYYYSLFKSQSDLL